MNYDKKQHQLDNRLYFSEKTKHKHTSLQISNINHC